MNGFATMVKKEILEIYRSKKLLILIILFAFCAIASPILAKLIPTLLKAMPQTPGLVINLPDPTWRDSIDQFIKNLSQIGLIVIIFMFSGSIAEEKSKKTLEIVLTKPISRTGFIFAKFYSSALYLKIVFILSAIVFYFYTVSILGNFSALNFLWFALFLLVFLILVLAVTIFFSTIFSNQILAASTTFFVSIIFTTVIGYIKKLTDYNPSYILSNYKNLMADGKIADFLPSGITSLALIIFLIFFAAIIFKRQEVER